MINIKLVNIMGIVAALVSMGASFTTDWVNGKRMDDEIIKKVNEAFTKLNKEGF